MEIESNDQEQVVSPISEVNLTYALFCCDSLDPKSDYGRSLLARVAQLPQGHVLRTVADELVTGRQQYRRIVA